MAPKVEKWLVEKGHRKLKNDLWRNGTGSSEMARGEMAQEVNNYPSKHRKPSEHGMPKSKQTLSESC